MSTTNLAPVSVPCCSKMLVSGSKEDKLVMITIVAAATAGLGKNGSNTRLSSYYAA